MTLRWCRGCGSPTSASRTLPDRYILCPDCESKIVPPKPKVKKRKGLGDDFGWATLPEAPKAKE